MATHAHPVGVHRVHFDPWHVAVAVLAAIVVGLGAWVVVDKTTGGSTATSDATALIDNFNAASMANDGAKAMTMMTPNAVLWSNGDVIAGAKSWSGAINMTHPITLERVAPVTVEGNYALTFVDYGAAGFGPTKSIFIYQLQHGKIAKLWTFVPGEAGSVPLDKVQPPK